MSSTRAEADEATETELRAPAVAATVTPVVSFSISYVVSYVSIWKEAVVVVVGGLVKEIMIKIIFVPTVT